MISKLWQGLKDFAHKHFSRSELQSIGVTFLSTIAADQMLLQNYNAITQNFSGEMLHGLFDSLLRSAIKGALLALAILLKIVYSHLKNESSAAPRDEGAPTESGE